MRRSPPLVFSPSSHEILFLPRFSRVLLAGGRSVCLGDTAVDSIPHFLILRFSPDRIIQLLPLPSDRSFSGCLLPLAALFNFLFDCFSYGQKKGGLMAAYESRSEVNGNVFVVDKNCDSNYGNQLEQLKLFIYRESHFFTSVPVCYTPF